MAVPALWPYHALLMTLGFILMMTGMLVARYLKARSWWLKAHKPLGVLGSLCALAGLFTAIFIVSQSTGIHFRVPHTYLGAITFIFVAMTPILGYAQLKVTDRRATIRAIHRWSGRITVVLMLITLLSGSALVGLI
ncbi:MAG: hypothetical protein JW878_01610 [Methanomicrobia archaeon]|nr:hypothetical protein [Methanomicrobia archaeon]